MAEGNVGAVSVVLVNRVIAHYREDLLREIARHPRIRLECLGGATESGIRSATSIPGVASNPLRNSRVGRVWWQRGVFRGLVRAHPDVVIFEGNACFAIHVFF